MTLSTSEPSQSLLASSYDDVPYTSSVYQQSQPNRLHALAKMKGLNPPAIETAKVLEIGCSFGGNILPFAILNPKSKVVGLDLSDRQIQVGRQLIEQVGLDNVTLISGDISQVTFEEKFDYIICHGVYSWVPESVREAILKAVEKYLSPNGIAYISYNTYPGWKEKDIVKDLMNFGCKLNDDPDTRYQQAASMLNFTKALHEENHLSFKHMDWLNAVLENTSKSYVIHEYLEYFNQPFYLKTFIEQVNRYNLAYITDSSSPAVLMPLLGKQETFDYLCQYFNNQVHDIEQYLDFIGNRTFRGSLLTHKQALQGSAFSEHVSHYNCCHHFKDLYFHTVPFFHPAGEMAAHWTVLNEMSLNFEANPTANSVFEYVQQRSPNPVKVEDVLNYAKLQPDYNETNAIDLLLVLVHLSVIYISYTERPQPKLGRKLRLNPKFQKLIQFIQANPSIVNLPNRFYQSYNLNLLETILVPYLDGTRNLTDLTAIVRNLLNEGTLTWLFDGEQIASSQVKDKQIKESVKQAIANLHAQGYFWTE